MKSIYVNERLHGSLKILASMERKGLAELVEEYLNLSIRQKMADLPAEEIGKLAAAGGSFDFLLDRQEDIYTDKDGEPL